MKNMVVRVFLAVLMMGVVLEVQAARGIVTTKPGGGSTSGKVASPPDSTIPGGATYMDNPSGKHASVSEAKPMAPREEASSSQNPGDAAATEQAGSIGGEEVSLNNVNCPKGCYVAVKDGIAGCICEGKWTRGGSGSAVMKGGSSHESRDTDSDNAPATSKAKDNQGKGTIRNDDLK